MNRENAEKLLAALIFDDLDEASKAELTAYLETDDELRERLAEMRMAAKVASDAVQDGPDPVLDERRTKRLAKLAERGNQRPTVFTMRYMIAAAAVVAVVLLPALLFMPSLGKVKKLAYSVPASESSDFSPDEKYAMDFAGGTSIEFELEEQPQKSNEAFADADSSSVGVPISRISNSAISTEDSPRSDKLYAKALRPEDTSGGVGGNNGGGYGGGGYGGGLGGAYTVGGSRGIHSTVDAAVNNGDLFDTRESGRPVSVGTPRSVERSYSYRVDAPAGVPKEGGDLSIIVSDNPSTPIVNRYFANSQSNYNVVHDGIYSPEGLVSSGNKSGAKVESPHSGERDGMESGIRGKPGLESPSATTKPVAVLETPPPKPKEPAQNPIFADGHVVIDAVTPSSDSVTFGKPVEELETFTTSYNYRVGGDYKSDTIIQKDTKKKAPLLGDLPVVGGLFKGADKEPFADRGQKVNESRPVAKESAEIERQKSIDEVAGKTRESMETQRKQAVDDYMDRAFTFQNEQRYDESIGQLDQLLAVDPQNQKALIMKKTLEHTVNYIKQRRIQDEIDSQEIGLLLDAQERSTPYHEEIDFSGNWKDVSERRKAATKETPPTDSLAAETVPGSEIKKQLDGAEAMGKRSSAFEESDEKNDKNADVWAEFGSVQMKLETLGVDDFDTPVEEDDDDLPLASRFKSVPVNPWVMTERDRLSTFALDVDTASYTLCRRYINGGYLPPAGAVRMEEFVNYFNYHYPQQSNRTFSVHAEAAPAPFADKGKNLTLLKIGVKARTVGRDQRKAAHLVFVIDTSASMGKPDRLPLVQQALILLVDRLSDDDRVTLITCSNQSRLHLEAVSVRQRDRIHRAINAIQPSGSTNLLAGLQLGYATARRSFAPKQINHVVLCSDGVANVGQTDAQPVLREVAADRQQGITMTCVGVGYGSYNDVFLESLANQGDGSYVFLDTSRQAQEVFVKQLAAAMHVVAKDARIQVSFNPDRVRRYRLIGYENRDIEDKRFRDDTIDAGEVGSGQCSTAVYELELTTCPSVNQTGDLGMVFVRYRHADTGQMEEISSSLKNSILQKRSIEGSPRFFLAAAASHFAEILRQSEHVNNRRLTDVLHVAEKVSIALPLDRDIRELAELIRKSEHLPMAQ